MTREQIEQAAAEFSTWERLSDPQAEAVDFAIAQVNAALCEAQVAVDSPRAAEAIEGCKVKP